MLNPQLSAVKSASRSLIKVDEEKINTVLNALADSIEKPEHVTTILAANEKDLALMKRNDPKYDRLKLTDERLHGIANEMRNIAKYPSPLNIMLEERDLPNGLHLQKITVPIGVIGMIYEARPNVTFDVFALCFKSGNACVLKGGSDAKDSNEVIVQIIHQVLREHGIDTNVCYLAPAEREAVTAILNADKYIDLVIPRGSQNLINFVRENAKMPVIETGAGIVHIYVDESADTIMARNIIENSKVKRPSVCNAVDCVLINKMKLPDIREIMAPLASHKVILHADIMSHQALKGYYPEELLQSATDEDFGREWLSLQLTIKTVSDIDEAIEHVATYSSKHSEAIVSSNQNNIDHYLREVDAAAVYSNASTYFTDGAQFGLGAEIGISTQKMHARGPMGLRELTSYKWVLRGNGQVR